MTSMCLRTAVLVLLAASALGVLHAHSGRRLAGGVTVDAPYTKVNVSDGKVDVSGRRSLSQATGDWSFDVPGVASGKGKGDKVDVTAPGAKVDVSGRRSLAQDVPKFDFAFHRSLAQDMPEDALCDRSMNELIDSGMTAGEIINALQNCPPNAGGGTPAVTTPAYPPAYAPPVTGPAYPPAYP
ncbi:hypothetical protein FOA52_013805 [Chlamydomonas sp. UWO 241]|nr:hypothetical protein FOA52_013805 [Chlamydomonas sp. UWO 241]